MSKLEGYKPSKFEEAFAALKEGKRAAIGTWSNDVSIYAQFPDENSKMSHPYLYVESRFGTVPWLPTQVELFSTDWIIIEEDEISEDFAVEVRFKGDDVPVEGREKFILNLGDIIKQAVEESKS